MSISTRRCFSSFLAFCLIFTQTAQAYSLARLPYTHHKSRTDGSQQSYSRSSLTSDSGNLIASGTDLAAKAGDLALMAGGTVALLAGQDTLNQSSSTVTVTNPNFFTQQRSTVSDSSNRLDSLGSTAQGNRVKVTSGNDIVLQAAQLTAGGGGINLDAGGDLKLLAAVPLFAR